MGRATQTYDFTLTAGGSQVLNVEGSFYRIQSATGNVEVRRDGGSVLGPLTVGQGERAEFRRLTLRDLSGGANSGRILVADGSFIDDTVIIAAPVAVRPEAANGNQKFSGALVANTPETMFTPGANVNGAVVLTANFSVFMAAGSGAVFLAKNAAPTTNVDGEIILTASALSTGANNCEAAALPQAVFVPAGLGLYFICGAAIASGVRAARWRLL